MDTDDFLILRTGEADGLVTPQDALEAIEDAWREYGAARDVLSHPASMALAGKLFKVKGAVLPEAGLAGFRLIAYPEAGARDWFWLAEAGEGRPLALIEASWLRQLRTAVTGALAAKLLAPEGIKRAALIGAGRIAAHLPAALAAALPGIETLHVAARRPEAVEAFCAAAPAGLSLKLHAAASPAAAVAEAELVILLTTAETPVLSAADFKPGTTVIGLGDRELAADMLGWADRFIVDELSYAFVSGTISGWLAGGATTQEAVAKRLDADIGEVAAGLKPGRENPTQSVLALIQGMAVGDLAVAAYAWRKARIRRVGIRVALGEAAPVRGRGPTPRRNRSLR